MHLNYVSEKLNRVQQSGKGSASMWKDARNVERERENLRKLGRHVDDNVGFKHNVMFECCEHDRGKVFQTYIDSGGVDTRRRQKQFTSDVILS